MWADREREKEKNRQTDRQSTYPNPSHTPFPCRPTFCVNQYVIITVKVSQHVTWLPSAPPELQSCSQWPQRSTHCMHPRPQASDVEWIDINTYYMRRFTTFYSVLFYLYTHTFVVLNYLIVLFVCRIRVIQKANFNFMLLIWMIVCCCCIFAYIFQNVV